MIKEIWMSMSDTRNETASHRQKIRLKWALPRMKVVVVTQWVKIGRMQKCVLSLGSIEMIVSICAVKSKVLDNIDRTSEQKAKY